MRCLPPFALIPVLLIVAPTAPAQVYKGVDADGRPIYTDRPLPDAAPVRLPPSAPGPQTPSPEQPAADQGFLGPYAAFEIASPADGATVRSADGGLDVSLLVDPPVQADHRLQLEVDGMTASGDLGAGTQLQLSGVSSGSHRLRAIIVDAAGDVVAQTPVAHVHLRPPSSENGRP